MPHGSHGDHVKLLRALKAPGEAPSLNATLVSNMYDVLVALLPPGQSRDGNARPRLRMEHGRLAV